MKIKKMSTKERLKEQHNLLSVFFQRPSDELVKENKHYKYVIFNHVGFHMPYFGSIYEHCGQGLGIPQESSDCYLEPNHVKIILPIKLTKKIRKIMESNVGQYSNCVPFVTNVLTDLGILKDYDVDGVDELYLSLSKYKIKTHKLISIFKEFEKGEANET